MMRIPAVVTACAAVLTGSAGAQAICNAPHSSPVLAQGGTIQTLAPGAGWIQVSTFRQASDGFFNHEGEVQPFLAEGRTRTQSVFVTAAIGLVRGIDAWIQAPVHDLRYQDLSGERQRPGVGDIRASLRFGPELVGAPEIPLALRAGVKLPGTTFAVDATIIPLSEGQRDWELSVESGGAFNRGAVTTYVVGWVGYRWRERSETSGRDPGDEVFGHVGIGGQLGGLRLELGAEAMFGRAPRQLGFQIPTGRRRLLQFQQTLGYGVGPGTLEFTSTLPVTGRSLPTGPSWSVGYRIGWGSQ